MHKQVYDGYRNAILLGDLRPEQEVPSSRMCAIELRISRFPVLHAYAQLIAEGYFETRAGPELLSHATFPNNSLLPAVPRVVREDSIRVPKSSKTQFALSALHKHDAQQRFGIVRCSPTGARRFPFRIWSSLVARHSRNPQAKVFQQVDPLGSERFREQSAFICGPRAPSNAIQQIMIVSGSQQALDITTRVLLDPGDSVLIEEPATVWNERY